MRKKIHAVIDYPNRDVIQVFEGLLRLAKKGEIIGIIYATQHRCDKHTYGIAGSLEKHPLIALGVTSRLRQRIQDAVDVEEE